MNLMVQWNNKISLLDCNEGLIDDGGEFETLLETRDGGQTRS